MIIRVTDQNGNTATIDNKGQVNGAVKIEGSNPLAAHLDRMLNHRLQLTFAGQVEQIEDRFLIEQDGLYYLYKASDVYLKEHFITVECPLFGYEAEILKE